MSMNSSNKLSSSQNEPSISLPDENPFEKYKVISELGSGGSAMVYKVENTKTRQIMAFKCYESHSIDLLEIETGVLDHLKGIQGVIEYTEIIRLENGMCGFIMPFFKNGNLDFYIRQSIISRRSFDESYFIDLLNILFNPVKNICERGVCQCDIKPENILVSDDGNLFLADFGLAQYLPRENVQHKIHDEIYTSWFRSPLIHLKPRLYVYSLLTELWALLLSILYLASITQNPHDGKYYYLFSCCPIFSVFRRQDYDCPDSQRRVNNAVDSVFKETKFSDLFKKWLDIERMKQMMSIFDEELKNALAKEFSLDLEAILRRSADCQRD